MKCNLCFYEFPCKNQTMDNLEEVLQCLNEFDQTSEKSLSPELETLLEHIAKTGRSLFPWHLLKPLISFKLEKVLNDFFESNPTANPYLSAPVTKSQDFYPIVQKLINNLNNFSGSLKVQSIVVFAKGPNVTPFTIQRLCELITQPRKHYKTSDKFLRGVEKNIMVVSTVQPDGALITRSLNTVLTNGTISPNETAPINTTQNTANNPVQSSPLNTNFQENGTSQMPAPAAIPSEEKPQTLVTQESTVVSLSDQVNGSQNEETIKQQAIDDTEDLICEQNGKGEKDLNVDENVALAAIAEDLQKDADVNEQEKSSTTETPEKVESDEKPKELDLPAENEKEEKMDES